MSEFEPQSWITELTMEVTTEMTMEIGDLMGTRGRDSCPLTVSQLNIFQELAGNSELIAECNLLMLLESQVGIYTCKLEC